MNIFLYYVLATATTLPERSNTCVVDDQEQGWTAAEMKLQHELFESAPSYQRSCSTYETVRLKSGEEIGIMKTGCAHLSRTISIAKMRSKRTLSDTQYYVKRILKYLKLPLKTDGSIFGANVVQGVEALLDSNKAIKCANDICATSILCGDATCTLEIRRSSNAYVDTKIHYDFAL